MKRTVQALGALLVVLGLLAPCAQGQGAQIREVTFFTWPPKANVYLLVGSTTPYYLGRANEPIPLDLSRFKGEGSFDVRFEAPGYNGKTEHLQMFYFAGKSRYPEHGNVALEPKIPVVMPLYTLVANNIVATVLVAAAAAVLFFAVVLPRRRRMRDALARAARWEATVSQVKKEDPLMGTRLGEFRLVEKLGEGGMGAVYRAVPEASLDEKESVAVKVMNVDVSEDDEFSRRFRREVSISCRLNHQNILRVVTWGEEGTRLFMVMELIKGGTLKQELVPEGMTPARFRELFRPVLEAIQYAHDQGIIHRDLKPENIMLTEGGRIKVMDFGLARGKQYSTITVTGTAMGTPAYMAPEQIAGGQQDARSDQYSLGVLAWEMLAGRLPFDDENAVSVIFRHVSEEPPLLRTIRPELPESLEQTVRRMLAKRPEERFADLREVMNELELAFLSSPRALRQ